MTDYLTTREVARYLRLNEKKVYTLVAEGQLPAARISGKWLFPRHLVDQWVEHNTVFPTVGLMGALLDEMLLVQGSDDPLLSRLLAGYQQVSHAPVLSAAVGSLEGLAAIATGKAHLAGCHVEAAAVEEHLGTGRGGYLVHLFGRRQGLLFGAGRPRCDLAEAVSAGLRFAVRQPSSGTDRHLERLLLEEGLALAPERRVGPFATHLELALALHAGRAEVGLGIEAAARACSLAFQPLFREAFQLAVPASFAAHPRVAGFLDFALGWLGAEDARREPGYDFEDLGRLTVVGGAAPPGWKGLR